MCVYRTYYCCILRMWVDRSRWPQDSSEGWHSDVEASVKSLQRVSRIGNLGDGV